MAIEFDCPACDATIRVKDDAAGKKGRCPKCRVLLLVPEPEPEDEETSPAPNEPDITPAAIPDVKPIAPRSEEADVPSNDAAEAPNSDLEIVPPQPPAATEEPVEDDLVVVSTPNPTPLPIVPDGARSRAGRGGARRGSRRRSASGLLSGVIAVIAFLALAGGAWFAYQATLPDVPDVITGERYRNVRLPPARFATPSGDAVADDVREPVMKSLASGGLPLKSGFVEVWLNAEGDEILVAVEPGPRSAAVRVPLGELASVKSMLSRERDHIESVKSRELRQSTADFFRDYVGYLESGTPMTRLPEYRDTVALNAATGVTGYAVEAIIGSTPFRCVYEDSKGGCYFFPPKETKKFHIRGRKLADGETPLPIEIEVIVKEAEGRPPVAQEETEPSNSEVPGKKDAAPVGEEEKEPTIPKTGADGSESGT